MKLLRGKMYIYSYMAVTGPANQNPHQFLFCFVERKTQIVRVHYIELHLETTSKDKFISCIRPGILPV